MYVYSDWWSHIVKGAGQTFVMVGMRKAQRFIGLCLGGVVLCIIYNDDTHYNCVNKTSLYTYYQYRY